MKPEIERLLGGYATNTLTEDERKLLYQAALDDQVLFNALEDEQALRDLLFDQETRRQVVRDLRPAPAKKHLGWFWGLAAAAVAAGCLLVVVINQPQHEPRMEKQMAVRVTPRPPATDTATAPLSTRQDAITAAPAQRLTMAQKADAPKAKKAEANQPAANLADATESKQVQVDVTSARLPSRSETTGSIAGVGGAVPFSPAPAIAAAPMAMKAKAALSPFVILKGEVELNPAQEIQAGDAIVLKLRSGLPGSLALSESAPDGVWTDLPPGAPIILDRPKTIRVTWLNPPAAPVTSILNLSPGSPVR